MTTPNITVTGGSLPDNEIAAYVDYVRTKHIHQVLESLDIRVDGEEVELHYTFEPVPFERIRRITGYLVGDMGRWNNGKRAEEKDRVKHDLSCCS